MTRKRKDIRVDSELQEVFAERAKALGLSQQELLKTLLGNEISYTTSITVNKMKERIEKGGE